MAVPSRLSHELAFFAPQRELHRHVQVGQDDGTVGSQILFPEPSSNLPYATVIQRGMPIPDGIHDVIISMAKFAGLRGKGLQDRWSSMLYADYRELKMRRKSAVITGLNLKQDSTMENVVVLGS